MIWKMTNLAFLGADLRLLQGWVGVAPPLKLHKFHFPRFVQQASAGIKSWDLFVSQFVERRNGQSKLNHV